jgi:polygalacturonase
MVSGYEKGSVFDGTYKQGHKNRCGRIKFGTESNGGFKNITITNCVFDECLGLALEAVDGGNIENVTISNIAMRDIYNGPIFIRLGNRARGPGKVPVSKVHNINISNLTVDRCHGQWGSVLSGIEGHDIENVRLSNITVNYIGGGKKEQASIIPPEKEADYPELSMFGPMPSYGFYCRHIKDIQFNNVNVSFDTLDDSRPVLVCDDVKGLELNGFRCKKGDNNEKMMILRDTKNVSIYRSPELEKCGD